MWHGRLHANGRNRGQHGPRGRFVGGRQFVLPSGSIPSYTSTSKGTYTLGNSNGTGSPLLVGGTELIGVDSNGTFTQNCGTNALAGGGAQATAPGTNYYAYNNNMGALMLGWYSRGLYFTNGNGYRYPGLGVGTYNLNGGILTGGAVGSSSLNGLEVIGVCGTGIFNQTGGTNTPAADVYVGGISSTDGTHSLFSLPAGSASGVYTLSGGLLNTTQNGLSNSEYVGGAGTGIMTQTAGTNITTSVILGGYATSCYSGSTPTAGPTPGTYNLRGGVFQTGLISGSTYWNINDSQDDPTPAYFNFTAGTLQALSGGVGVGGLNLTMTMTVGTAASNVATLDANGQLVNLNSEGLAGIGFLTGLGQLRVIDSVGGGKVVLGGSDFSGNSLTNNYSGGTTVLSGTLQVVNNQSLPTVGVLTVGGPGWRFRPSSIQRSASDHARARHRIEPGQS